MEKVLLYAAILLLAGLLLLVGCRLRKAAEKPAAEPFTCQVVHPEWSKNATVYEVNIRQFSEEGTFNGLAEHLPRLNKLGVDILWLMPIHPIGIENRKGELGSYYSVSDYKAVNPEFGTLEDFTGFLEKAHAMGFHVLLDWVPNHTAWDNPWATEHPDWYMKNEEGEFIPPIGTDWTDVIQLDWSNMEMQDAMLDALRYWVELGVDGYRVDHPHKTPKEFWERVRPELEKIRPVLMLAENEEQTYFLEKGFDMNYAWELHHLMNEIAQGKKNVNHLRRYFSREDSIYPANAYRLRFLSNHDENSWQGTVDERMGAAHGAMAVFMFTMTGVPLLYNGQEACLDKRLEFFTRDPIEWKVCDKTLLYQDLIRIKKENPALWNGTSGGPMQEIITSNPRRVFAFSREKDGNRVISILNLSRKKLKIKPAMGGLEGEYTNALNGQAVQVPFADSLALEAWDYLVLLK
jgi:1,4-alpha-glucan branching enzyme